jgi:4-diphosphocytidyl-2-C-methyl-D-erythritol kinase
MLLGVPPFGAATAEVYAAYGRLLTGSRNDVSVRRTFTRKFPGDKDFGFMVNDLEAVVFERWPELEAFRDALEGAGAGRALLSGSGSTVYGVFETDEVARGARERLQRDFPGWRLVHTHAVQESAYVASGHHNQEGARAWKSPR